MAKVTSTKNRKCNQFSLASHAVLSLLSVSAIWITVAVAAATAVHAEDPDVRPAVVVVVADGVDMMTGLCPVESGSGSGGDNDDDGRILSRWISSLVDVVNTSQIPDIEVMMLLAECGVPGDLTGRFLRLTSSRRLAGVLTLTSEPITRAFREVTGYLDIPLVEMVLGNDVTLTSTRPNHYVVPHFSATTVQNVIFIAQMFQWTSLSASHAPGLSLSPALPHIFEKMAADVDLCVLPASLNESIPEVAFGYNPFELSDSYRKLYVTHMGDEIPETFMWAPQQHVLALESRETRWSELELSIRRSCSNLSDDYNYSSSINDSLEADPRSLLNICSLYSSFPSLGHVMKNQMVSVFSGVSFILSLSGASLKDNVRTCADSMVSSSNGVLCLMLDSTFYKIDSGTNRVLEIGDEYRVRYLVGEDPSVLTTSVDMNGHTLLLPRLLPHAFYYSTCGEWCRFCVRCFPDNTAPTKVMTSGEGDYYILGLFPLHSESEEGLCSEPNIEGYVTAVTFLEEFRSRNNDMNSSTVHAIVFDNCDFVAKSYKILDDLDSCSFSYEEVIEGHKDVRVFQPLSILGVVYSGDVSRDTSPAVGERFLVSLDDSGYSASEDPLGTFAHSVLALMDKIQWRVINVVVTDHPRFLKLLEVLETSSFSEPFCFVTVVVLPVDKETRSVSLDLALSSSTKTSAYLLLTNMEDTRDVIRGMRIRRDSGTVEKFHLVFTPWNQEVFADSDVKVVSGTSIILRPSVPPTSVTQLASRYSGIRTHDNAWRQEFNATTSDMERVVAVRGDQLTLVQSAVRDILVKLGDRRVLTGMGWSQIEVSSNGFDVVVSYDDRYTESRMGHVSDLYQVSLGAFQGGTHLTCSGWCPACNRCKTTAVTHYHHLHQPGDVIITGLFPLHLAGPDPFTCGFLQPDTGHFMAAQAFLYALDTAKSRYPYLLPNLELGGLVLDSCSDASTGVKVLGDFETCSTRFGGAEKRRENSCRGAAGETSRSCSQHSPNPTQNIGYVLDAGQAGPEKEVLRRVFTNKTNRHKDMVFINDGHDIEDGDQVKFYQAEAIIDIFTELQWDKLVIVAELSHTFVDQARALLTQANRKGICVVTLLKFETNLFWRVQETLYQNIGLPVVLLSTRTSRMLAFDWLKGDKNKFKWIVSVIEEPWTRLVHADFPLGALVVDTPSKYDEEFFTSVLASTETKISERNTSGWYRDLWRLRFSCNFPEDDPRSNDLATDCPLYVPVSDLDLLTPAISHVIRSVDAILHGLHERYLVSCPLTSGICEGLADVISTNPSFLRNVNFLYQGLQLGIDSNGNNLPTVVVNNVQRNDVVKVGTFFRSTLTFHLDQMKSYTSSGVEVVQNLPVVCPSLCQCLSENSTGYLPLGHEHPDYLYWETPGVFTPELWTIIVVGITSTGVLVSLILAAYVIFKVCKGALGRRYVGLGLLLLFALMLLYLAVLPMLFSPSNLVCGLRYLMPGLAFSLYFSAILVKLMSLQNYKSIGLGGEVSGVNQFITVFFVFAVQVAVSVQWWVNHDSPMYSEVSVRGVPLYACRFDRTDFAVYHVYNLFLLLVCSTYAIAVRKEKKNLGEARLLLVCCWLCVVIWITWLLCFFLFDRKYSELTVCAALLGCATCGILVVFVPKVRQVARLRYDLAHKAPFRNGYSVDTDFLYERPYSLPGTLSSTFSSAKLNIPKTFSNFDSELNY